MHIQLPLSFHSILLVLATLLTTGCATIVRGTKQEMTFDSNPKGAQVFINDKMVGETPLTLKVDRKEKTKVIVKKEGYSEKSFSLETEEKMGWMIGGNLISSGTTGTTTDLLSGAYLEYSPDSYYIDLVKSAELGEQPEDQKQMILVMYILSNYADISAELIAGDGPYTRALHPVLTQRKKTLSYEELTLAMLELRNQHGHPPAFAEAVASYGL